MQIHDNEVQAGMSDIRLYNKQCSTVKQQNNRKLGTNLDLSCTDDGNPPVGKSSRTNFSMSFVQVNRGGSMPELPRISVISKMRVLSTGITWLRKCLTSCLCLCPCCLGLML